MDSVEWIVEHQEQEDADFSNKIGGTARSHLDGLVNPQNYPIWGSGNPRAVVARQLHPQCATVPCRFCTEGTIIGPFFLENAAGQAVTSHDTGHHGTTIYFCVDKFPEVNVNDMWCQQDSGRAISFPGD